MDGEAQRRAADENLIEAFALVQERLGHPAGGRTSFGAVQVVACGVPTAFFNPVLALAPDSTADDLRAGVAWVEGRGLPPAVNIAEDLAALVPVAESLGLVADEWRTPVLVLDPIPQVIAPDLPVGVRIRTGGDDLADDWYTAFEATPAFRELFGRPLLRDDAVRIAVADLDGAPVGGAMAVGTGTTLGVYAVGTVQRARRRGIARAATWAVIDAGRSAWGSTIAILQSSEMGLPLYRSMGFVEVSRYVELARRPASPG